MIPRLIRADTRLVRTAKDPTGGSRNRPGTGARVALALSLGECTPCVAGIRICCRLNGFSIKCGPEPC